MGDVMKTAIEKAMERDFTLVPRWVRCPGPVGKQVLIRQGIDQNWGPRLFYEVKVEGETYRVAKLGPLQYYKIVLERAEEPK